MLIIIYKNRTSVQEINPHMRRSKINMGIGTVPTIDNVGF